MNDLRIRVEDKTYQNTGTCTLKDIQLDVNPGEFVAIVGPSGAGKSTLLNMVAGLDQDFEGKITVDNEPLHAISPLKQIGFMFQESRLMPWLTVLDNLLLVLGKEEVDKARELLRQVHLTDIESHFPGQLSGGMQRRVALARAFAVKPDLLLMDEPFMSLDAPTAEYLRGLLMDLWSDTKPMVLFVTHYLREALALADRIVFLSEQPAHIVLDMPVNLERPRMVEDADVNKLHAGLLQMNPNLLSGLVNGKQGSEQTITGVAS